MTDTLDKQNFLPSALLTQSFEVDSTEVKQIIYVKLGRLWLQDSDYDGYNKLMQVDTDGVIIEENESQGPC